MRHRDDRAELVVDHRQARIVDDEAKPDEHVVDDPLFCSITFHALVRTRSDVQNGSSTRIIRRFAVRIGRLASSHAIG